MKQKILAILVSIVPSVVQAQEFDIVASSDLLQQRLATVLRGLSFPGTIGTETVNLDLPTLQDQLLAWKTELEAVLENDTTIEVEGQKLPLTERRQAFLVSRYFAFLSYLVRINKLATGSSNWQRLAAKFDLRVPMSLAWSQSLQAIFKQMVVSEIRDGQAILRLKATFVDGLQAVVLANEASVENYLEVLKYTLYSKLYRQLVQNEQYRGEPSTGIYRLLPVDFTPKHKHGYELELRQAIINYHRFDHQKTFIRASLIESYPRFNNTGQRLKMPLINNWPLYQELQKKHPNLTTFTTTQLAQQLYRLLPDRQRQAIAVNNSEQFRRFMLLVEHLLLDRELSKALQDFNTELDDDSLPALRQSLIRAKMNALLAGLMQLRINDRQKLSAILVAIQQREQQLLADQSQIQEVGHWYDRAKGNISDLQDRSRQALIKDLLFIAWKVKRIETSASEPVNMQVLRRSLLRSFFVNDFTGEFQQSLAKILQTKSYLASKETFFVELSKYLSRLGQQLTSKDLDGLSAHDLTDRYLKTALTRTTTATNPANDAVHRKVTVSQVAQLKSFVQYGHWFGYFLDNKAPTLDDLPLSDQQKENYFRELKFAYFDRYPFLLLKIDSPGIKHQELYLALAEALDGRDDLSDIDEQELEEKFWPLIVLAIDRQQERIIDAIVKIDRANSVQDIKHVVANSPTVNMALKEFAGLYPLHEKFIEIYHKPSKLRHNWEKIDLEYIGGIFNIFIAQIFGSWLLRRTVPTSYLLRYLTPMFGSAFTPYYRAIQWAWYIILVDFFVIKPAQAFIINPQKVAATSDYFYLGNQHDQFFSRTHIDYIDMEKNSHLVNYAFEASLMGIFVGVYGVNRLLGGRRLLPELREKRLEKDLDRLKIKSEVLKGNPEKVFTKDNIRKAADKQITFFQKKIKGGKISEYYSNEQIRQVELARDRTIETIDKKLRMWEAIKIEHRHDFASLGKEPTHRLSELSQIFQPKGFKQMEQNNAFLQINISLSRLYNAFSTYHSLMVKGLLDNRVRTATGKSVLETDYIAILNRYYQDAYGKKFNGTGLGKDYTKKDLNKIYRQIEMRYHPDKRASGLTKEETTEVLNSIRNARKELSKKFSKKKPEDNTR